MFQREKNGLKLQPSIFTREKTAFQSFIWLSNCFRAKKCPAMQNGLCHECTVKATLLFPVDREQIRPLARSTLPKSTITAGTIYIPWLFQGRQGLLQFLPGEWKMHENCTKLKKGETTAMNWFFFFGVLVGESRRIIDSTLNFQVKLQKKKWR